MKNATGTSLFITDNYLSGYIVTFALIGTNPSDIAAGAFAVLRAFNTCETFTAGAACLLQGGNANDFATEGVRHKSGCTWNEATRAKDRDWVRRFLAAPVPVFRQPHLYVADPATDSRRFSIRRQVASSGATSSFTYPYTPTTEWIYDTDFFIGHFGETRTASSNWDAGGKFVDINADGSVDIIDYLYMLQVYSEDSSTLGIACPPAYCPERCLINLDLYAADDTLTCSINDPSCNSRVCARRYSDGAYISWQAADFATPDTHSNNQIGIGDGIVDVFDIAVLKNFFHKGHGDNARPDFDKANPYRVDTDNANAVDVSDFIMMKKGYNRCVEQGATEFKGGPADKMCQVCDNDPATMGIDPCGF